MNIPTNPDVARDDLALLVDLLGNQYVADKRMLASPETSRGDRQELTQRSAAFEGILTQILQPEAANYLLDTINGVSDEIKGYESMSGEDLDNIDFSRLSGYQINLVNQVQKYKVADALAEQREAEVPK